ncbi:unnamed protein product [Spirodela intermedia]|uniref:Uncharacterized protein n=1 Tax=Spirodela intermedia TaxID=51605 RepID=A0A7I8K950_SPIIN|nr:unnamed protein product [Spirodela intermedia]
MGSSGLNRWGHVCATPLPRHRWPADSGRKRSRGVSREQGLEWLSLGTRHGTCTPLPFHVTGGQPAVGIIVQCPRPQRLSLDKDDVGNL